MGEVARYAQSQGADVSRVATMGESAGGHLALTVGCTATGGSPGDVPEAYEAIDPAALLGAGTPPTSVVVGENDHLVPPQGAYELAEALDAAGVDNQLVRVPFGEHGMDLNTAGAASRIYRETSVAFLREHGLDPAA